MTKAESLKVGGEEDERRKSLHISVAKYLDQNGFSKTLRKFIKEAKVQKDSLNDASSNLEEMYAKYMEACNAVKSFGNQKLQDGQIGTLTKCEGGGKETVGKKNKKGSGESENHDAVKHSEASSELTFSKKSKVVTDDTVPSSDVKSKEKKKSKKNLDSAENVEDSVKASADDVVNEENLDSAGKKSAHKSGNKSASESVEGTKNKEKKNSKKRKGSDLEENDSKSRKTVDTKQKMTDEVEKSERGGKQLNEEGEQANPDACVKTPCKDLTSLENGNSGQEEQKSASQKSSKKQCGSSSEPKTVNAFSRVKIEDVTFADERLQDNSYWAKHGADSGYGAKAQEVLGQVRGRDFRHEKTKKKRGCYRGGQIDLQSHSIKFNYSDEDE